MTLENEDSINEENIVYLITLDANLCYSNSEEDAYNTCIEYIEKVRNEYINSDDRLTIEESRIDTINGEMYVIKVLHSYRNFLISYDSIIAQANFIALEKA
jgi:hypothetical protein